MAVAFFVGGRLWNAEDAVSSPVTLALGTVLGLYLRERFLQNALVQQQLPAEREQLLLAAQAAADDGPGRPGRCTTWCRTG